MHERLVLKQRCMQEQKCTTGTLPAPEVSVDEILKSLRKKLSVLTTRALADEFLRQVGALRQEQIRSHDASAKMSSRQGLSADAVSCRRRSEERCDPFLHRTTRHASRQPR